MFKRSPQETPGPAVAPAAAPAGAPVTGVALPLLPPGTPRCAPSVTVSHLQLPWAPDAVVIVFDDVMSDAECAHLVARTEAAGYTPALVDIGGGRQALLPDTRNSDRCMIDSAVDADMLWARVAPFLPRVWRDAHGAAWQLDGLNERLRFLRYTAGQFFAPHRDGCFRRADGSACSFLTYQLYLSEMMTGGATRFLDPENPAAGLDVEPRRGRVLVFQHDLMHEGAVLRGGLKYALRTDVMYCHPDGAAGAAAGAHRRPPPTPRR